MRHFVLLSLCVSSLAAQTAGEPPALGYLFDPDARELRALVGTPGAAQQVRVSDAAPEHAAVHSRQGWTLQSTGSDAGLTFVKIGGADAIGVKDSRANMSAIAFSAAGTAAIAWYADARIAQVITGIPDAPAVSRELAIDGTADLRTIAVSDDGQFAALGLESELRIFAADDAAVRIARKVRVARFVEGSHDLLFTAPEDVSVWLRREQADEPEIIYTSEDGSAAHDAFLDPKGNRLLVAAGALIVRDLQSGASVSVPVPTVNPSLEALRNEGLYRVSAVPGKPVWIVDLSGGDPVPWFIPAIPPATPAEVAE